MSDTDIDANAAGFIEGPPRGFPNLKTFGGFDAMPDLRVEAEAPAPAAPQPPRPSGFPRPTAN